MHAKIASMQALVCAAVNSSGIGSMQVQAYRNCTCTVATCRHGIPGKAHQQASALTGRLTVAQQRDLLCAGACLPEPPGGRAKAPCREQFGNGAESAPRRSLHLEHAQGLENECDVEGPFDVVLMDLALPRLLHALLQVQVH